MNSPKGAVLEAMDDLRLQGLLDEEEDEELDMPGEAERPLGETRWQVRSLTEIAAAPDADDEDPFPADAIPLPPELRRRLEREVAEEDAVAETSKRPRKRRASGS